MCTWYNSKRFFTHSTLMLTAISILHARVLGYSKDDNSQAGHVTVT